VKVLYTTAALRELDGILETIAADAPRAAAKVQARLRTMIDLLPRHPNIGWMTSRTGMRRMLASPYPYLAFYRVTDIAIVIHGVRHGARRPSTMPR
jgi:plasmid stabilization system protein ParE